ncbi:MAG: FliH/SctL family protein [Terracidiphilus sp.]
MNQVEIFEYPPSSSDHATPEWSGYGDTEGEPAPGAGTAAHLNNHADWDKRLAEEVRKAFDAGRERGREEARTADSEALTNARRQEERRMAGVVESFTVARDGYLRAAESEVVKLALAVAARILRREAQMDPLLLTGAVRVALGQLSATTEVRLRVPATDLELWREAIAYVPNLAVKPEVLAGEELRLGDCVIESNLGTVDLGIRSQLGEIERGFFDRAGGEVRSETTKEKPASREASE